MPINKEIPEETSKLYDAFISHSSLDSDVAIRLANELEQKGFFVWLDKREVLVGHNIVERVDLGLSDSRFTIVMFSKASIQSGWVKSEWTAAYVTEIETKGVVILPVLIEPCSIPTVLRSKRYADLTNWDTGINDILDAMKGHSTDIARRVQKPTEVRMNIVSSPLGLTATSPSESLSDLLLNNIMFTSIPKARFRNMSLLIQVGGRVNVLARLDNEDAFMMEGLKFGKFKWKWYQDCESIPCMVLSVDKISGEFSSIMLPTYHQVSRLLDKFRMSVSDTFIFLFLTEDASGDDIVGIGVGLVNIMETVVLRSAYISFFV